MGGRRRIAMFNLNMTHRDPRVLRTGAALIALGHEVIVFEMLQGDLAERETIRGLDIRRIPIPESYTDADMAEIGQVSPEAATVIQKADHRVYAFSDLPLSPGIAKGLINGLRARVARVFGPAAAPPCSLAQKDQSEILAIRSIMLVNLAIFRAARSYSPEIVHCNDLDTLMIGFMFKKTIGSVLVFDAHEIYPEQLAEHMRSNLWHSFYTNLERDLVRWADAKLTVCDSLGEYFARVYDAPGFVTVRNLPSRDQLSPESVVHRRRERPKILYHGSYFAHRGLEEVIQASRKVGGAAFVFRGVGSYVDTLRQLAVQVGVEDRVTFADPVPVDELVPSASECDIGLSPFIPVCKNTEYALPNKFFEYLMAGLACVSSDLIEMRRHTEHYRVGRLFSSPEPEAIAEMLNDIVSRPSELAEYRCNALRAAQDELNWEQEVLKFQDFYRPILQA